MPLTLDELTTRLVRCIGIWETNRGGNDPNPIESKLNTVCGVHASMATIEQATMPYAVDAFRAHAELRAEASPNLTAAELTDAARRCDGVKALLASVAAAFHAGTNAAAFTAKETKLIADAGVGAGDVATMFRAEALLAAIKKLNVTYVQKTKGLDPKKDKEAIRQILAGLVASIPSNDRLGLDDSTGTYIRRPEIWGENRAGWQRKAVNAMPNNIGARIETVSISQHGTALAVPIYRGKLAAKLGANPVPQQKAALQPLLMEIAQTNNPKEAAYGQNVWNNYDRLYP